MRRLPSRKPELEGRMQLHVVLRHALLQGPIEVPVFSNANSMTTGRVD